jgi:hypothetical protein
MAVAVSVAVSAFILTTGSPFRFYRGDSPKRLQARMNSALPIGSSLPQVLAFLDANHIDHAPYVPAKQAMVAIKRNTCWALLTECSIEKQFSFDGENKYRAHLSGKALRAFENVYAYANGDPIANSDPLVNAIIESLRSTIGVTPGTDSGPGTEFI